MDHVAWSILTAFISCSLAVATMKHKRMSCAISFVIHDKGASFSGRTLVSKTRNEGPIPSAPAKQKYQKQLIRGAVFGH